MSTVHSTQTGLLAALRELQHQPAFADVTLQLKEGPVRASKILLAAMSPVFKKMALERPAEDLTTMQMPYLSQAAWQCVVDFYLCGQASLSLETVADALDVSDHYQLDELKKFCADFLTSCCNFQNCQIISNIAKKFNLEEAAQKAQQVFKSRLNAGFTPEALLSLEKTELLELLEKEDLADREDDVCQAVLAWMETTAADSDSCTEVFQHVKLGDVSDDFLVKDVLGHSVCGRTPALRSKVQDEMLRRCQRTAVTQVPAALPRSLPDHTDRGVLVVGCDESSSVCAFFWSHRDKKWTILPRSEQKRSWQSAGAMNRNVTFITEGCVDSLCFNSKSRTWSARSAMMENTKYHSMVIIDENVYVVAGHDNTRSIPSIERYSMTTGHWSHEGELPIGTHYCGVTALGDTILAVGGIMQKSERVIQTFNVKTKEAFIQSYLPRPMRCVKAAVFGDTAFFVGNEGDMVQVREVEGTFQAVSCVKLEKFYSGAHRYGVHVEKGFVRVIGGKTVLCWTWQGQKVDDDVADLPEDLGVLAVGEVDFA